jgi:hypothetical protein
MSANFLASSVVLRALQYAQMFILVALLLPSGSVEATPLHLMATLSFIVTALASLFQTKPSPAMPVIYIAFIVLVVLLGWIMLQASDLLPWLAHPVWGDVNRLIGPTPASISVAPADTMQGIVAVALPFSIFIGSAMLFSTDNDAYRLIRFISISGGLLALFALIEFLAFPDMLMFSQKMFYKGALTAPFVNRNSAATYYGMMMIASFALCFSHVQNAGLTSLWRRILGNRSSTRTNDLMMGLIYVVCGVLAMLALIMTKSRAGTAASFIGLIVIGIVLAYYGGNRATSTRGFSRTVTPTWVKLLRAGLAMTVLVVGGLLLSGQALFRAEAQGAEDWRFCIMPGLLRLTSDNWATGTGMGTFKLVFPAYRDAACGFGGIWERAHNFYLDGWIALGALFGVAAVFVILALFTIFIRGLRARKQYRWIPAMGVAIVLIQMLHNIVDFSIQIPAVAAIFAALLGAAVSVSRVGGAPQRRKRTSGSAQNAPA